MSASTEAFDTLAPQARAFTRREVRATRAPVSPQRLSAFLDDALGRYVAGGGVRELTEAVIADTRRSITRYCMAMPVSGYSPARQALFHAVRPLAKAWAKADRRARRAPVDRDRLRAYLNREAQTFCAVPGQACDEAERAAVVEALTAWFGRMRAVKADAVRTNATRAGRDETRYQVETILACEQMLAEDGGRDASLLSIDAILTRLKTEHLVLADGRTTKGLPGVTRSAVRGAVERIQGQPRRAALIDRLTPTARDLAVAVESELPGRRISVVETVALAGKLWAPARTAEGRRQHARRLRVAAKAIEAADIGLHLAVLGEHTVVGRGRRLPEGDALQAIVDKAISPKLGRKGVSVLSRGLVPSRQGLWGTEEGEVAKAVCRVAASDGGHDDVWVALAAVGQEGAAQDFSTVWDAAGEPVQSDSLVLADTVEKAAQSYVYGRLSAQSLSGVALVRSIVERAHEAGLDQAWAAYVAKGTLADRLRRPEQAGARERVRRIGAALSKAPCPAAWEAAILLDAYATRPGRRHIHPVVAMTRPAKPLPAPTRPEFEPTYVPLATLSPEMAEEITATWRYNKLRPAGKALRAVFMNIDIDDAMSLDLDELPSPSTVDDVMEGLRRALKWWRAPQLATLARLDTELGGALRDAIVAAGIDLRDHGAIALPHAVGALRTVTDVSYSLDTVRALPRTLRQGEERFRWTMAQRAAA